MMDVSSEPSSNRVSLPSPPLPLHTLPPDHHTFQARISSRPVTSLPIMDRRNIYEVVSPSLLLPIPTLVSLTPPSRHHLPSDLFFPIDAFALDPSCRDILRPQDDARLSRSRRRGQDLHRRGHRTR